LLVQKVGEKDTPLQIKSNQRNLVLSGFAANSFIPSLRHALAIAKPNSNAGLTINLSNGGMVYPVKRRGFKIVYIIVYSIVHTMLYIIMAKG